MSIPTYTPTNNNDQAGVERVFGLPDEFDSYKRTTNSHVNEINLYLNGDPSGSHDTPSEPNWGTDWEHSIRVITNEIRDDVASAGTTIDLLNGEVYGKSSATGDEAKSLRTLIAELQDRVSALENPT